MHGPFPFAADGRWTHVCTYVCFSTTQVITTQHLLQFGALLGESSAELALTQGNLPRAMGRDAGCLLGATDDESQWAQGWEQVACEVDLKRGLHYCAWRRYLRKGLYVYKARTGGLAGAMPCMPRVRSRMHARQCMPWNREPHTQRSYCTVHSLAFVSWSKSARPGCRCE